MDNNNNTSICKAHNVSIKAESDTLELWRYAGRPWKWPSGKWPSRSTTPPPRWGHLSWLAMCACSRRCRPMNDQTNGRGCRPWPSGVCLTDNRAMSARHCNRSRLPARPQSDKTIADWIGPISRSLLYFFVHLRAAWPLSDCSLTISAVVSDHCMRLWWTQHLWTFMNAVTT